MDLIKDILVTYPSIEKLDFILDHNIILLIIELCYGQVYFL